MTLFPAVDHLLPLREGWDLLDGLYYSTQDHYMEVQKYLADNPPAPESKVIQPVVIAGTYRTGTTFLHRALSEQRLGRYWLGWEATVPVPPSSPDGFFFRQYDKRAEEHDAALAALYHIDPQLEQLHPEPSDQAAECVRAMAMTGLTGLWPAVAPCYAYVQWLLSLEANKVAQDAYLFYNDCLRSQTVHETQWLLKAPQHSLFLGQMYSVWPDAIVININRKLDDSIASAVEYFAHLRRLSKPLLMHKTELMEWIPEYLAEHIKRIFQAEDMGASVIHVDWKELRHQPDQTVNKLVDQIREIRVRQTSN